MEPQLAMIQMPDNIVANNFVDAMNRVKVAGGDVGVLKNFVGPDGRCWMTRRFQNPITGNYEHRIVPTNNATTIPQYAWAAWDTAVERALRLRLQFMADVKANVPTKTIPNAFGRATWTSPTSGDVGPATMGMDPTRRSKAERQTLDNVTIPLPVFYKDGDFSWREIEISHANNITGVQFNIDDEWAESAGFAVADLMEMMAVGYDAANTTALTFTDNANTLYGLYNFPSASNWTSMTVPDGTNGTTVLSDWLYLRGLLKANKHHGPYMVYVNSQWDGFLDGEFKTNSDRTLRERLLALPDILGIRTLDHLPSTRYHVFFVEMQARTVRPLMGTPTQTINWESDGGYMRHYKVIGQEYVQFRADTAGTSGVGHGSTS